MSITQHPDFITTEMYLYNEHDGLQGSRYEYVNGHTYPMAGASRNHNAISMNFAGLLFMQLRGSRCRISQSDMKVAIKTLNAEYFYYPDVQVSCAEETHRFYNTSPCLIVEVLSESTARTDRTEKLAHYRLLPSLQEYVLCSQESPLVEIYRRKNEWKVEYFTAGQSFKLDSVDLEIQVNELYDFLLNTD